MNPEGLGAVWINTEKKYCNPFSSPQDWREKYIHPNYTQIFTENLLEQVETINVKAATFWYLTWHGFVFALWPSELRDDRVILSTCLYFCSPAQMSSGSLCSPRKPAMSWWRRWKTMGHGLVENTRSDKPAGFKTACTLCTEITTIKDSKISTWK